MSSLRPEWSTVNYKGRPRRQPTRRLWCGRFPHDRGASMAPARLENLHPIRTGSPATKVILNGWGCGESHLGLYAQKARVNGELADLASRRRFLPPVMRMAIGKPAGYTAMLRRHGGSSARRGSRRRRGPIIVTGPRPAGSVRTAVGPAREARLPGLPPPPGRPGRGSLSQGPRRIRGDRAGASLPVRFARSAQRALGRAASTASDRRPLANVGSR